MALVLNILWFILGGGFVAELLWMLTGTILNLTIVGIPFEFAHFRLAGVCFAPPGKTGGFQVE